MAVRTILDKRAGIAPATLRRDLWWLPPLITVVVLLSFVAYGTWVAFSNSHYYANPYVSPFYSPCIAANCEHTTFRLIGTWWGFSPALLAEDAAALIRALDLDRPILLGHSLGAGTAATVAATHPDLVRDLLLEDPVWEERPRAEIASNEGF